MNGIELSGVDRTSDKLGAGNRNEAARAASGQGWPWVFF
ncbi:hypothetical protein DESA109040_08225 [Deinococcus saxicola]